MDEICSISLLCRAKFRNLKNRPNLADYEEPYRRPVKKFDPSDDPHFYDGMFGECRPPSYAEKNQ